MNRWWATWEGVALVIVYVFIVVVAVIFLVPVLTPLDSNSPTLNP